MGVTGLWKLIEPCGKPVPVETLEGKVLAVDISIWLHQVVKGFQDNKGAALNNAHLLGLFHRLCKLMYYRVKPVFVFDGCVPQLKMDTIARRQKQRSKLSNEADRIQDLLLQSLAREKVVQQALGPNAQFLLTSPIKKKVQKKDGDIDDMFKLPDLPENVKKDSKTADKDESMDDSFNDSSFSTENYTSSEDTSYDESNPRSAYNSNIQAIDVRSRDFKQLPVDVRHDILVDIKETRKQSSWGRLHELPARSDDFSTFQMKRLLKRRDVQVCLEEAEKEMGNDHALTYSELTNIFTEEGILESEALKNATKQIASSENTRFLLVRDLKKKIKNIVENEEEKKKDDHSPAIDNLPSTSKTRDAEMPTENKKHGDEFDADLELAIALSLQDGENVYDEKDYDYDSDEKIKLNRNQRQRLQDAAKGPARSYMIEYAGMNKEEVQGILEKTQIDNVDADTSDIERLIGENKKKEAEKCDSYIETANESQEIRLHVSDDSDSTDSDLEEVEAHTKEVALCITVDVTKEVPKDDDLFADVFENKPHSGDDECVIPETPEYNEPISLNSLSNEALHTKISLADHEAKERKVLTQDDECVIEETPPIIKNEREVILTQQLKPPCKQEAILNILDELKQQANDIKNIKLDSIKLSNSIIEISDDELPAKSSLKEEVIEICDSDDNKRPTTPVPQHIQSVKSPKSGSASKSPKLKTPSKNHAITEFFNVDYVVKRTPDRPTSGDTETTPKVKSPFFIKKTPKSANKSGSNSPMQSEKISKASKTLFEQDKDISRIESVEDGIQALKPLPAVTEKGVMNEAAELLKSNKTTEELNSLAESLARDRRDLENERNRQDRMSMSITQRMNSDCQELLRLFGVPYIIAPMEAEAQCAFLDIVQLTNGTITDDSDIWLFGGRTVYKNFFAQNKHVMEFRSEQIEKDFNCDRKKLIQLACLVGSDYTTGIHGIGAVTALEILASFAPKDSINNAEDSMISAVQNILLTLQRFRNWWQSFKTAAATPPGSSARLALQKKLKNIELHEGFPNMAVVEAYLSPKVDENKEPLSWGSPDVESLREFAKKTFGWTTTKTDDILMPVMKKLNEKRTQQSIRNYFNVKNTLSLRQIKVSKRVQNAIDNMAGNVNSDDNTPDKKPTKRARQTRQVPTKRKKASEGADDVPANIEDNPANTVSLAIEPSCSIETGRLPTRRAAKRVNIPSNKEVIPQRERTLEQLEANKKLAAEILKKSAKVTGKKRKA